MSKKQKKSNLNIKVSGESPTVQLNTSGLFRTHSVQNESPIDIYIKRNKALLVKLGSLDRDGHIDASTDSHLYNLFLLGMVSNVESFFRCLLRELILIDKISYEQCLEQQLTYAAAMHHNAKLLPEALLEQCTFISLKNIRDTTKSYLNIAITDSPLHKELVECIRSFEQLCQIRHCIVHRAGLLGSKNAIKLGIEQHKSFFEKPIYLDLNFLQESNAICLNCVRNYNNFIFNSVLARYVESNKSNIAWNYNIDRKWFKQYYDQFNSEELNLDAQKRGAKHYSAKVAYDELREHYEIA